MNAFVNVKSQEFGFRRGGWKVARYSLWLSFLPTNETVRCFLSDFFFWDRICLVWFTTSRCIALESCHSVFWREQVSRGEHVCIGRSRRARHMEQWALKNPESNANVKIHTLSWGRSSRIEHKSDAHYVSWKFSPGHSLFLGKQVDALSFSMKTTTSHWLESAMLWRTK